MSRWFPIRLLLLVAGILALVAALPPFGAARVAPTLTLEPARGPCAVNNPPITVLGSGFPVGIAVTVLSRRASDSPNTPRPWLGDATVAADGTFRVQGQLGGCAPVVPEGAQFIVSALHDMQPADGGPRPTLAEATFTKSSSPTSAATPAASTPPGLPNTGSGGAQPRLTPDFNPLAIGGLLAIVGSGLLSYGRWRRRVR